MRYQYYHISGVRLIDEVPRRGMKQQVVASVSRKWRDVRDDVALSRTVASGVEKEEGAIRGGGLIYKRRGIELVVGESQGTDLGYRRSVECLIVERYLVA